jgi:hypothetical protein
MTLGAFKAPMSRGEIKVKEILEQSGLLFEQQYVFPELTSSSGKPLRFDFAVFDDDGELDFLIEYNGEQHYTAVDAYGGGRKLAQQKFNDTQKLRYCAKHGYRLVVVPYYDYEILSLDYIFEKAGI